MIPPSPLISLPSLLSPYIFSLPWLLEKSYWFSGTDWSDRTRRKQFFDTYAKHHGFDPNIPDNWYTTSFAKILAEKVCETYIILPFYYIFFSSVFIFLYVSVLINFKGAASVIAYHHNRIASALMDLYPNIGLDKHKFWAQSNTLFSFSFFFSLS